MHTRSEAILYFTPNMQHWLEIKKWLARTLNVLPTHQYSILSVAITTTVYPNLQYIMFENIQLHRYKSWVAV